MRGEDRRREAPARLAPSPGRAPKAWRIPLSSIGHGGRCRIRTDSARSCGGPAARTSEPSSRAAEAEEPRTRGPSGTSSESPAWPPSHEAAPTAEAVALRTSPRLRTPGPGCRHPDPCRMCREQRTCHDDRDRPRPVKRPVAGTQRGPRPGDGPVRSGDRRRSHAGGTTGQFTGRGRGGPAVTLAWPTPRFVAPASLARGISAIGDY
jgi:hypothetical protein